MTQTTKQPSETAKRILNLATSGVQSDYINQSNWSGEYVSYMATSYSENLAGERPTVTLKLEILRDGSRGSQSEIFFLHISTGDSVFDFDAPDISAVLTYDDGVEIFTASYDQLFDRHEWFVNSGGGLLTTNLVSALTIEICNTL